MTKLPTSLLHHPRVRAALEREGLRSSARIATRQARGRMNATEARYARHLELQRIAGEIIGWRYESIGFRLATRCFYYPDFAVLTPAGVRFDEIKGLERDDARDKFKIAAEQYPWFRWRMLRWLNGQWEVLREL